MTDANALLAAARRILTAAGRDLARGLDESACVSAHRGAVLATEAWLRRQGQVHVSNSVHENVCLSPIAGPDVREAALKLDRHRVEEGYPHRSFQAGADPVLESREVVAAGRRVLRFVEEELGSE